MISRSGQRRRALPTALSELLLTCRSADWACEVITHNLRARHTSFGSIGTLLRPKAIDIGFGFAARRLITAG